MPIKSSPHLGYPLPPQYERKTTSAIIVHCSATPEDADIGAKEIDRWHRARGFSKIGYHYVIRRDGTLEHGRPVAEVGAHCKEDGMNRVSIGICLVGGVDADDIAKAEDNYTDAQMDTLKQLITLAKQMYPTIKDVLGHRDVPGVTKACPCFNVRDWVSKMKI